jgi:hypothetical protein
VTLQSLEVSHPSADKVQAAFDAIDLKGVGVNEGPANLKATLNTPKGVVVLESLGL